MGVEKGKRGRVGFARILCSSTQFVGSASKNERGWNKRRRRANGRGLGAYEDLFVANPSSSPGLIGYYVLGQPGSYFACKRSLAGRTRPSFRASQNELATAYHSRFAN